jgi:hypothetical protein
MSLERIVSRPCPDGAPSDQTIIVEAVREVMQQLPRR